MIKKTLNLTLMLLMLIALAACTDAKQTPSAMDKPIDASTMKMFEVSINILGKELNDEEKAQFGKAIMTLNVGKVIDEKTPYDPQAAKTAMLAALHGKTPNEIIAMADKVSASH